MAEENNNKNNQDTKYKVLIVEDETSLREPLAEALAGEGFSVVQAKDGKDGFDKALAERPDIILLDLLMPERGGMEMLRLLRQDAWGANAEIIVLTNLSNSVPLAEALANHAHHYMVKSDYSMGEIVSKVRELLALKG